MAGNILIVDDNPANAKLLAAYLSADYFQVAVTSSGEEALGQIERNRPDLVLLDIRMPGMDGFEVCRRLRLMRETADLPIIMITAFDPAQIKIDALESGADEFMAKPVDPTILLTRIRNILRMKLMSDELRLQESEAQKRGLLDGIEPAQESRHGKILLIGHGKQESWVLNDSLSGFGTLVPISTIADLVPHLGTEECNLAIVNLEKDNHNNMRMIAQLRALPSGRTIPILATLNRANPKLIDAFNIGVNDAIELPLERRELTARVRTLIRSKRHLDAIRRNVQLNARLAHIDGLTGVYNRRFMDSHLGKLISTASVEMPLSLILIDIDHFKDTNDRYGHALGDVVLKEVAQRILQNIRASDCCCRYGGEEFVILMPKTDFEQAVQIAERLRTIIEELPFVVREIEGGLTLTVSMGVTRPKANQESAASLLHRVDQALYSAKHKGRNRVISDAAQFQPGS